jgi:hypothetical protein
MCVPAVCDEGYFGDGGAVPAADAADTLCTACPAGKTTNGPDAGDDDSVCALCAKGWFWQPGADDPENGACVKCAVGTYKAIVGNSDQCMACPTEKTTTTDGAVALASCNSEWRLPVCGVCMKDSRVGRNNPAATVGIHVHGCHVDVLCLQSVETCLTQNSGSHGGMEHRHVSSTAV